MHIIPWDSLHFTSMLQTPSDVEEIIQTSRHKTIELVICNILNWTEYHVLYSMHWSMHASGGRDSRLWIALSMALGIKPLYHATSLHWNHACIRRKRLIPVCCGVSWMWPNSTTDRGGYHRLPYPVLLQSACMSHSSAWLSGMHAVNSIIILLPCMIETL